MTPKPCVRGTGSSSDCLAWLQAQTTKSIDLILTDPPYGLNVAGTGKFRSNNRAFSPSSWDTSRPSRNYFNEMRRISHNQIIWGGNYFADFLPPSRCWIAWWKNDRLPRLNFADCELAWTSFDRPAYVYNCRWRSSVRDSKESLYPHPTQKPLAVMRWCVEQFTEPDALIADPFLGTGTTAVAATALGRRCIGIESDREYFDIAARRLSALPCF
ncbi:MAG: site-specific DNA-methyltransferase [Hyphomicrobium sp.]|nr:MAG: site-specific DNA-methyltransferase [Hyphomicrobium sp.]